MESASPRASLSVADSRLSAGTTSMSGKETKASLMIGFSDSGKITLMKLLYHIREEIISSPRSAYGIMKVNN